ncbi:hypothetical protein [Gordonia polyisoprenivorans]|uniref:hypothetical protein n=1 Tax=Gordonia polyisoprenivorans TaxID=84595 RepID=UPI001FCC736C|nr:hypothetical protein [Gordonia polyisoprenivorans]
MLAGVFVIELRHRQQTLQQKFDAELPLLHPIAEQTGWNIDDSKAMAWMPR